MENGQTDLTNGTEHAAQSPKPAKKARKNGNTGVALLKAKHGLDDVLRQLGAFPDLRTEAAGLREKVLTAFLDEERKTDSPS